MNSNSGRMKAILIVFLISTVFMSTAAASNWNITSLNNPYNNFDVSNDSQTIQLVNLETDQYDTPISEDMLTDSSEFNFRYNSSEGPIEDMQHLEGGIWYTVLNTDKTKHVSNNAEILYNASGVTEDDSISDSGTPAEERQTIKIGDYSVEVLDGVSDYYESGAEEELAINITNITDDSHVNKSNVKAYFTNGTWQSDGYTLEYNRTEKRYYNESVELPESPNETYVLRVLAYNRSVTDGYGSYSAFTNTLPEIEGEISEFSSTNGCMELTSVQNCEPGATISTEFNVTQANAESVNMTGYLIRKSDNHRNEYFNKSLEKTGSTFSGDFNIPDINTSKHRREVIIQFNATNGSRQFIHERSVNYNSLSLTNTGNYRVQKGKTYNIEFFASTPYTIDRYNKSRFSNIEVEVNDSNDQQFVNRNINELTFNQTEEIFTDELNIPEDASDGTWDFQATATDKYSHEESTSWDISIETSDSTDSPQPQPDVPFNISNTTFEKQMIGEQEFELAVQNNLVENITLETNRSENLEDIMNISEDGEFNVTADSTEQIPVTVNTTEFNNVTGTVNFTDPESGHKDVVEINITAPNCRVENNTLCSTTRKTVNISKESEDKVQHDIEILNKGLMETNLTSSVTGNVSDHIEINENFTLNKAVTATFNYTAQEEGNYTGQLMFTADDESKITFNLSAETNISTEEREQIGFETDKSEIRLGIFPEGHDKYRELLISNIGDYKLENISFSSSDYITEANNTDFNLETEQTETVNITFSDVQASEGNLTIEGNTTEGLVNTTLPVNATLIENYKERTDELRERKEELEPVYQANLTSTLTEVSSSITKVSSQWDSGDYIEARETFKDAQARLEYVANNKEDEPTGGDTGGDTRGDTGGETGGTDEPTGGDTGGETGNPDNPPSDTGTQEEDGGLPTGLIAGIVILLILIVGGFVFYESYIPEEGDPLYGVLGDQ